jgi:hypothetical protein
MLLFWKDEHYIFQYSLDEKSLIRTHSLDSSQVKPSTRLGHAWPINRNLGALQFTLLSFMLHYYLNFIFYDFRVFGPVYHAITGHWFLWFKKFYTFTLVFCDLQTIRPDQTLLVLMDIQKGYITGGQWALGHVGDMQHLDTAVARVANLLPTLSTNLKVISLQFRFNDSGTDTELINSVVELGQRRHVPNFIKRRNNMMEEPKFATYIHSAIHSNKIKHIIIIDCTITFCIRESVLSLKTN